VTPATTGLRLGTRGSPLALWQASEVARRLEAAGGPPCRTVVIKTAGDRLQDAPIAEAGGKRLFVKEIEEALIAGDIDLAVHSSKDLPVDLPDGLVIAAVLPREDPLDAIVLPASGASLGPDASLAALASVLGPSPSIGTGSVRRIAQLARMWPAARFTPVRGNLETRLRKLDEGRHEALVLAAAGLRRLGLGSRISLRLPASACVPAPGQGIVAVEVRQQNEPARTALAAINDPAADAALRAERALVTTLGGGCQMPVGALASLVEGDELELMAIVSSIDGRQVVEGRARGARREAADIGARLGTELLARGAGKILTEIQAGQSTVDSRQSAVDSRQSTVDRKDR
jgi:hydroxymethylbilane synthase